MRLAPLVAQLFRLFLIMLLTWLTTEARIPRRHQKRSAPRACVGSASQQIHESFSRLLNRHEEQHFSIAQPDIGHEIRFVPKDGHLLTSDTRECTLETEKGEQLPDQPLYDRSFCPYHHKLNYKPERIPAAIPEVVCNCHHVKVNNASTHCEPMYYNMRVMYFDVACETYVERVERIALACLPVFPNHVKNGVTNTQQPTPPPAPI